MRYLFVLFLIACASPTGLPICTFQKLSIYRAKFGGSPTMELMQQPAWLFVDETYFFAEKNGACEVVRLPYGTKGV